LPKFIDEPLLRLRQDWAANPGRKGARLGAWLDTMLIDHGFVRVFYPNRWQVAEGVERASHPTGRQVRNAAKRGVKTIINLRGDHPLGPSILSALACRESGIALHYHKMRSRGMPTKEQIYGAKALFETAAYPLLFHCKSGADRAGIMSALYVLIMQGGSAEAALKQLSWRFGHIRQAKTGMLDFFVESYRDFNAEQPIAFMDWVEQHYDEAATVEAYYAAKRESSWASLLVDRLLRRE
jgi:protein tyrosine/serine phosphatase